MNDFELGELAHEWEDEYGSGNKPISINKIKKGLVNSEVSYANIIRWLERPDVIVKLEKISKGTVKLIWDEGTRNSEGVVIINEGWKYKCYPEEREYTIEYLMKDKMGIENIPYFINYFNRYVRTWYSFFMQGYKKKYEDLEEWEIKEVGSKSEWEKKSAAEEEEESKIFDWYPIDIKTFLWISGLSNKEYNIDMLVDDCVCGKEIVLEKYKTKKEEADSEILKEIISLFPGKVDEYKKGKTNLINMFLGEYLKRLKDKNVDKTMLLTGIKNFIENN